MGLLDYALDADKEIEVKFEGSTIRVKHIKQTEAMVWVEERMPMPTDDDDEEIRAENAVKRTEMKKRLLAEYTARFAVTGWDDPDLEYSSENALRLLTSPEFQTVVDICFSKAATGSNFKMARDHAIKKFVPSSSETNSNGELTTKTQT